MAKQDEVTKPEQPAPVPSIGAPPAAAAPESTTSAEEAASVVDSNPGATQKQSQSGDSVAIAKLEKSPPLPVGEGPGRELFSVAHPPAVNTEAAPVGELRITWQQKGEEVAPLLEMRAYLDQLRAAGVAVGALTMDRDLAGKLSGGFAVSYDPNSNKLGQLEAALQGFRQVGSGVTVQEPPEQVASRRQEVGYDNDYEPLRSRQVREAFGLKQWDGLSAQLSAVPKHALTAPEQAQQDAAEQRVQHLAQQQGTRTEQVLRDGKSIFDIDTSGNPASAFLKNFYAHLHGGPKTRQHLEVDYEKTRRHLQARLTRQVGETHSGLLASQAVPDADVSPLLAAPVPAAVTPQAASIPSASAAPAFQLDDVPQKVLTSLGLDTDQLARSKQLQKLLGGEKTDLLPLQVAGQEGLEPVKFEGKLVLHRETDGTATLKLELPQEKLVVPQDIGGHPFTPEQRQRLETEGNAGLIRGLRDAQGREFNGYVAVDKAMNKVVVLPENKVTLHDTVAGVKLTPEQSHDLREGKVVALANMASSNGGQKFDGTVQVNAAKSCLEVKPAAHELTQQQRQTPKAEQTVQAATQTVTPPVPKEAAPQLKNRGPRR